MTVVGVPVINRPDLLLRFLDSIDTAWPVVVIDNSPGPEIIEALADRGVDLMCPSSNLGVAASWNLIIRMHPDADWWCIANADAELGRGDLERLASEMAKPGPRWVGINGDWRVFGINAECIERAGWFDENFHPIYCEDADYEYRCRLAGVPAYSIAGAASHVGSAAIRSGYAAANARTYPANVAYFEAKWGGRLRGGETFATPFNRGGSIRDWTLDLARLRDLSWETTMILPEGETR
jgi:GT2 family glycosyltransferase